MPSSLLKAYYPKKVYVLKIFTKPILLVIFINLQFAFFAKSQDSEYDSLLNYYLESDSILLDQLEFELAADSLSILDLIDSILYSDFRFEGRVGVRDCIRLNKAILKINSCFDLHHVIFRQIFIEVDVVNFLFIKTGVGKLFSKFSIIGKKE